MKKVGESTFVGVIPMLLVALETTGWLDGVIANLTGQLD